MVLLLRKLIHCDLDLLLNFYAVHKPNVFLSRALVSSIRFGYFEASFGQPRFLFRVEFDWTV